MRNVVALPCLCSRCEKAIGVFSMTDDGAEIGKLCESCLAYVELRCSRISKIIKILIARGVHEKLAIQRASKWAC